MKKVENDLSADNTSRLDQASDLAHEVIDHAALATYEVANKIVDTGDELSEVAHENVEKATATAQRAFETLNEKKDQLRNIEQKVLATSAAYVRDNPITSVGIAVGAGFLLSKLLK